MLSLVASRILFRKRAREINPDSCGRVANGN